MIVSGWYLSTRHSISYRVPGPARRTAQRKAEAEVRMVEHLLSALYGLRIDNLVIETNAMEMPVGDGSALNFVEPFMRAGIREMDAAPRRVAVKRPVAVVEQDILMVAMPGGEGLTLTHVLDYGKHFLRAQSLTLSMDRDTYIREIVPARTYVLRPEVDAFVQTGLGKGATPENTIVLEEDGSLSAAPRFEDECVRHKLLDLVGDLSLCGGRLSARVIGYKSGHGTNVQLAKAIRNASTDESVQSESGERNRSDAGG